jgi:uncharacterized protein YrrD
VASDTAENVGTVKGFVVDRHAKSIEAIHVAGRGRHAQLVPWHEITSFGSDAVMASRRAAAAPVETGRDVQAIKGDLALLGHRVITTAGDEVGTVDDVEFDARTGQIEGVVVASRHVPRRELCSIGSFALVIDVPPRG